VLFDFLPTLHVATTATRFRTAAKLQGRLRNCPRAARRAHARGVGVRDGRRVRSDAELLFSLARSAAATLLLCIVAVIGEHGRGCVASEVVCTCGTEMCGGASGGATGMVSWEFVL